MTCVMVHPVDDMQARLMSYLLESMKFLESNDLLDDYLDRKYAVLTESGDQENRKLIRYKTTHKEEIAKLFADYCEKSSWLHDDIQKLIPDFLTIAKRSKEANA